MSVALLLAAATTAGFFQGAQHPLIVAACAAALASAALALAATRGVRLSLTATDLWVAGLAAALTGAMLASRVAYLSASAALWLALFFAAYAVARRLPGRLVPGALGAAGVGIGLVVVVQHLFTDSGIGGPFLYRYLMTAVVLVCAFLFAASRHGRRSGAPLMSLAALVAFVMIGISGSRGLLVAGVAGVAAAAVLLPRGQRVGVVWFGAGALAGLVAASLLPEPVVLARATTLADPTAAGEPRFVSWFSVLPLIAERPWFGHGPGLLFAVWPPVRAPMDLSAGFYAHNVLLDYAVTAGLPAALLLLAAARSAIYAGRAARTPAAAWVAAAVVVMAVHGLVDFNLLVPVIWLLAGVAVGTLGGHARPLPPALSASLARVLAPLGAIVGAALLLYGATSVVGWQAVRDGDAALARGEPQQALLSAQRAMRWWPASDSGPLLRARTILEAALEQPGAADNPAAAAALRTAHDDVARALARNPLRPASYRVDARLHLAGAALGLEPAGVDAAQDRLAAALAVDPRDMATRSLFATVLVQQDRPQRALTVLVEGLRYLHDDAEALRAYTARARALAAALGQPLP